MSHLFLRLLRQEFLEENAEAVEAGLSYDFKVHGGAIEVYVSGFVSQVVKFIPNLVRQLSSFSIGKEDFDIVKSEYIEELSSSSLSMNLISQALWLSDRIMVR